MADTPVLTLDEVTMKFGGLTAVSSLDIAVNERELVGLIGPNGAGKTTAFNVITGVYQPTSGCVRLRKELLTGCRPNEVCRRGIARTFQNIRLFKSLTVYETMQVAMIKGLTHGYLDALVRMEHYQAEENAAQAAIMEILELFHLTQVKDELAVSLPYGDQRRVEIVRALATRPSLLLLDEPAAGMNPTEKQDLMNLIRRIREQYGLSILLIEHDMTVVMGICDRVVVLDYGVKIAEGNPEAIRKDPKVIEAYLGEQLS